MTTRDVLRWNLSPRDALLIAGISAAACAIGVLDFAIEHLERWIDSFSPAEKSQAGHES